MAASLYRHFSLSLFAQTFRLYYNRKQCFDYTTGGKAMTRIYFVRHAQAEGNLYRICEGQYDGLLTNFGREQLPCVTAYFQNIKLDAVYTSDLYRARETAKAVAAASGLPVIPCRGLREIDFGQLEGMPWSDIYARWPVIHTQFDSDFRSFEAPGGESAREAAGRMLDTVTGLAARHPSGDIAVVAHSAVFAVFFPTVLGGFDTLRAPQYMKNAAVTVMETDGTTFRLLKFNDDSHLQTLAPPHLGTRPKIQFSYRCADARRDEAFIRACGEDAWRAVYGSLHLFSSDRFYANARGIIEADCRNAFIPLADGKPAGLLLLDSRQDDEPFTGHIALVYLLPEYRGMGLGAQLIGRAVIAYRARGMKTLRLNVATVNKSAQRFYDRMGFRRETSLHKIVSRQLVMKLAIDVPCESFEETL